MGGTMRSPFGTATSFKKASRGINTNKSFNVGPG